MPDESTQFLNKNDFELALNDIIQPKFPIKNILIAFSSSFGILWGFLEPLNFFGIGTVFFENLKWFGYIVLIICSLLSSTIYALIYMNNNYKKLVNFVNTNRSNDSRFKIITKQKELVKTNIDIVKNAKKIIVTTGSRSRDKRYLKAIEDKIINNRELIYYRVLWGPPYYPYLKTHLLELLDLRDPHDRSLGEKTIFLSMFIDIYRESEKFICANENEAVVILPSFTGIGKYDTAIVFYEKKIVKKMIRYVQELYNSGIFLEEKEKVNKLPVLRENKDDYDLKFILKMKDLYDSE